MSARAFALLLGAVLLGILASSAGWLTHKLSSQTGSGNQETVFTSEFAPGFSLPDLDGTAHSLADLRGKIVLLNFWATWCPPCVKEMPYLVELQNEYGSAGLQVLGLTMDKPESARPFAAELGINYPLLGDQRSVVAVQDAYGENRLPFSVLIDREGKILWRHAGELSPGLLEPRLMKAIQ